ncbi:hypothetical protein EWB00_010431 [Schistosoma japonicum]|uniref:Uncharacterized protein n=1 Tax=Schistosoma japonicum TaxID=6182 RepID=A0A4Z2DXN2_SCHJA|nr:hypothetical protein EWB00_010431 [Schistosoma japonicum]
MEIMPINSLFSYYLIDPTYQTINEYEIDYDYDLYGVPISIWKFNFNYLLIYLKYYLENYSFLLNLLFIILFLLFFILINIYECINRLYQKIKIINKWKQINYKEYLLWQQKLYTKSYNTIINYRVFIDCYKLSNEKKSILNTLLLYLSDIECVQCIVDNLWAYLSSLEILENIINLYNNQIIIKNELNNISYNRLEQCTEAIEQDKEDIKTSRENVTIEKDLAIPLITYLPYYVRRSSSSSTTTKIDKSFGIVSSTNENKQLQRKGNQRYLTRKRLIKFNTPLN